ncbi:TonB-dependent receptor [Ferrimonas pelagia]|uniref:TonB-dependent receptor n=1 Tax=Ferrimonas pelagia TaxID=1177826 RepID=A0ABP9EGQ3_9GAMM
MNNPFSKPLLLAVAVASSFAAPVALAQTTSGEITADIERIAVKGYRDSLANSLREKQEANQFKDVVTAEDIGLLPENNITESLQRISGVSIERSNGEGQQVSIRGLAPNFTKVEVNGRGSMITSDSSDPGRGASLSALSSEMFQELEVIKSPTAKDAEGGIGGIVRLNTAKPLEHEGRKVGASVQVMSNEVKDDLEPSGTFFYQENFDEKFGVLFSASHKRVDNSIDKFAANNEFDEDDGSGAMVMTRGRDEVRSGEGEKTNLNLILQAKPTENANVWTDLFYARDTRDDLIQRVDMRFDNKASILDRDSILISNGTIVKADYEAVRTDLKVFERDTVVDSFGASIGGDWYVGDWVIDGQIGFSQSKEDRFEAAIESRFDQAQGGYDIRDTNNPSFWNSVDGLSPDQLDVDELSWEHRVIETDSLFGKMDFKRFVDLGAIESISFGYHKEITTFNRSKAERFANVPGYSDDFASPWDTLTFAGAPGNVSDWRDVSPAAYLNSLGVSRNGMVIGHTGWSDDYHFEDVTDRHRYDIEEDTDAFYIMADLYGELFGLTTRGNFGGRYTHTTTTGNGAVRVQGEVLDENLFQSNVERSDGHFLPSANIALVQELGHDQLIYRASFSRALTRPNVDELSPVMVFEYDDPNSDGKYEDNEIEMGNPDLDPFLAWQYDLGMEYYFGEDGSSVFGVGLFYKDVENFTLSEKRDVLLTDLDLPSDILGMMPDDGRSYELKTYRNGGSATIKGAEVNFQTPFTFLPQGWDGFGVNMNYTYTDSQYEDLDGNARPFPGSSKNTANATVYYEQDKFSTRFSYNYRDDYLLDADEQKYGAGGGRLDFALRYYLDNGLRLTFDVMNITGEKESHYYNNATQFAQLDNEGRIYSVSASFQF